MRVISAGSRASRKRAQRGSESTHWRTGTLGMTWSTRWIAVPCMRRVVHEGQKPRPRHEKRDEHVLPAGVAVHAREAVGEDAAREVPLEFGDDEAWEASAVGALGDLGEKRFPVGANGLVEDRPRGSFSPRGRSHSP